MGDAVCVDDPLDLVLDEQVVVGSPNVSIVAKPGVRPPRGHGVLRNGDPADAILLPTGTFGQHWEIHIFPGLSNGEVISPEEWRQGRKDGSGATVNCIVPSVAVL